MKEYLQFMGINNDIDGPRGVLKVAFAEGLIYNGDEWIKMMEARNNMSHRYDYEESRKKYFEIKDTYVVLFEKICDKLKRSE